MPSQVKSVLYEVRNVSCIEDLIEMMRYDAMRFPATTAGDWKASLRLLCRHSAGVIEPGDPEHVTVRLVKDQVRDWTPHKDRWRSYQMEIEVVDSWSSSRLLN